MNRNPGKLAEREYDLVIIGAGIYGVCAAWDATLRGLSVAIVDRGDFCGGTSANPLKIVHGGFRYTQQFNFSRIRASSLERNVLMRIAPHLVSPLPFLIPTYGHGMQGKEVLSLGLLLYGTATFDRNRGIEDAGKRIPWGEVFSRQECLRHFPTLDGQGLTGAVAFYDAQMYSPPRLALSYLRSAVEAGADAANYVEVTGFLGDWDKVSGVRTRDILTGEEITIQGRLVLNTSGPWTGELLRHLDVSLREPVQYTKDLYLVVDRVISEKYALAVPSRNEGANGIVSRGRRHLFVIPWRGGSLVGSSHIPYKGGPDDWRVTEDDVQELIDEVNAAYPPLALTPQDVQTWNSGLVPCGNYYGEHSRVLDHERDHGLEGLVSVIGVRYTTSRGVAQAAVDLVLGKLGRSAPSSRTAETHIHGGDIQVFDAYLHRATEQRRHVLGVESIHALVRNHGSEHESVLRYIDEDSSWAEALGESQVIKAEVVHAVREEMAQKLGDVVFRRTDLGTAGDPGEAALRGCAALMATELGWDQMRTERELDEVRGSAPWRSRVFS